MGEVSLSNLNEQQILSLAAAHVKMYDERIRRAALNKAFARTINVDACKRYLGIWRSIATKVGQGSWRLRLTTAEANEIKDAIESGSYDQLLLQNVDAPS